MVLSIVVTELRRVIPVAAEHAQIDTGGKRTTIAGEYEHANVIVIGAAADDVVPFLEHRLVETVEVLRAVQGHSRDAIWPNVEGDCLIAHVGLLIPVKFTGLVVGWP